MKFTIAALLLFSCIGIIQSSSVQMSGGLGNFNPIMNKDVTKIRADINQFVGKMSANTWNSVADKMLNSIKNMVKSFQHMCGDLMGFVEYIRGIEERSAGFAKDVPDAILQKIHNDIFGMSKTFANLVKVMENLKNLIYDMKANVTPTESTYTFSKENRIELLGYVKTVGNLTADISSKLNQINKEISLITKAIEANYPDDDQPKLIVQLQSMLLTMSLNYQEIASDANTIEHILQEAFAIQPMSHEILTHSKISKAINRELGSILRLFIKIGIFALKLTADMTTLENALNSASNSGI